MVLSSNTADAARKGGIFSKGVMLVPTLIEEMIRDVATKFGLPPEYMLGKASYESNLNPRAVSPTGARGLFQITRRTGREYGLNRKSAFDPQKNTEAAARLTKNNIDAFRKRFGRDPDEREMYLMHQQGATGAAKGFERPGDRAIDVYGRRNVRVNTPRSERGRMSDMTAKEFQEMHSKKFMDKVAKFKNVPISDEPQLAELQPPKPKDAPKKSAESQILSQLAPTEEGRTSMPMGFDEAIKQALTANTENVEVVPAAMFPPVRGARGRMSKNPMNQNTSDPRIIKRLTDQRTSRNEGKGPYEKGASVEEQMGGTYGDYVRKEKARMNEPAEVHTNLPAIRSVNGTAVVDPRAGAAQNDPAFASKYAERMRGGPLAKATTAAGATAAGVYGDEALQAVYDTINNVGGGTVPTPSQQVRTGEYNVDPSVGMVEQALGLPKGILSDPNTMSTVTHLAQRAMPKVQQIISDPNAAQMPVGEVAKQVVSDIAKQDAIEATSGGTRRQLAMSRAQMDPTSGLRAGDPMADRLMEMAVGQDSAEVMRGGRSAPPVPARIPQPPRAAVMPQPPQAEIPQAAMPTAGGNQFGTMPPWMMQTMGNDPAMMQIYSFLGGLE